MRTNTRTHTHTHTHTHTGTGTRARTRLQIGVGGAQPHITAGQGIMNRQRFTAAAFITQT